MFKGKKVEKRNKNDRSHQIASNIFSVIYVEKYIFAWKKEKPMLLKVQKSMQVH